MTDQIRRRSRAQAREFMNFTKSSKFQFNINPPPLRNIRELVRHAPTRSLRPKQTDQINYGIKAKCNVVVCESLFSCALEW